MKLTVNKKAIEALDSHIHKLFKNEEQGENFDDVIKDLFYSRIISDYGYGISLDSDLHTQISKELWPGHGYIYIYTFSAPSVDSILDIFTSIPKNRITIFEASSLQGNCKIITINEVDYIGCYYEGHPTDDLITVKVGIDSSPIGLSYKVPCTQYLDTAGILGLSDEDKERLRNSN